MDAGNCHRSAQPRLIVREVKIKTGKLLVQSFHVLSLDSTQDSDILFPLLKEATFGISGVTICLQLVPFLYYDFAQESLDLLPSQPAQLEASLVHLTGVIVVVHALQTLIKLLCSGTQFRQLYPDP